MRYVICDTDKARSAGMALAGRMATDDGRVLLNESGVTNCRRLEGSLEERAAALGGKAVTESEARDFVRDNGLTVKDVIQY